MTLYHEYENKIITYLVRYFSNVPGLMSALTKDELESLFLGGNRELTSSAITESIFDLDTTENENLCLLYPDEHGKLTPLLQWDSPLPIRTSIAERAWLFYALKSPKADLFLDYDVKNNLLSELQQTDLPDISSYIENKGITQAKYRPDYISRFKDLRNLISEKRWLAEIKCAKNNKSISYSKLYLYKISYDVKKDAFTLIALDTQNEVLCFIPTKDITYVDRGLGTIRQNDAEVYSDKCAQLIQKRKVDTPIVLEIISNINSHKDNMAHDRCAHLFSSYDTTCYDNETGNLTMEIRYYDYQYEDIKRNILSLGRYVHVISPSHVVDDIISILRKKAKMYGA